MAHYIHIESSLEWKVTYAKSKIFYIFSLHLQTVKRNRQKVKKHRDS